MELFYEGKNYILVELVEPRIIGDKTYDVIAILDWEECKIINHFWGASSLTIQEMKKLAKEYIDLAKGE